MPPIDPERLLRTLAPLLDSNTGSIKSPNEVDKLYGLMSKFSKKLVSKCIYINILKKTRIEVMDLFMQRGGWDMLCTWTTDAVTNKNWPLLGQISELLLLAPVTITRLKDNDLPKIIKNLSKECECEATKHLAKEVYDKWMEIAKETSTNYVDDNQGVSLNDDANLVQFELPSNATVAVIPENQIILEPDPTSGAFDLTQYIDTDNLDLNNLETEFNPDDFNSTVDRHLMEGSEVDGDYLLPDSVTSGHLEGQDSLQQLVNPVNLQSTDPNKSPVCLVIRDGKRFLLRVSQVGNDAEQPVNQNVQEVVSSTTTVVPVQKVRSRGKPKMPSGKPKMPSPGKPKMSGSGTGKPPFKSYEAKTKKGTIKEETSKGIANFYGSKDKTGKVDKGDNEKVKVKKEKEGKKEDPDKKKSKRGISATEAAWKAEQERSEKLRQRIAEQKRIRDQRKEEAAKKQKEKDDETLKALKLTALPPTKIPKIPKKTPSFSDMIAIPGANSSKDKDKKIIPTKTSKEKETNQLKKEDNKDDLNQRRSRAKVFTTKKSRADGLLADMEQTLDKNKNKEKEKKENLIDVDSLVSPGSSASATLKKSKRPSTENNESPTASKKPKVEKKKEVKKATGGLQESSLFMDALTSSANTRTTRSRRRASNSDVKEPLPTPPPQEELTKPVVFNFYRDTLENNDDKAADDGDEKSSSNQEEDDDVDIKMDSFEPSEGEGLLKSALVIHRPKNKPKKTVRWVDDEDLKKYHYFEMDDTERVNVTRIVKNFTEMKQIERSEERKVFKRTLRNDNMEEKTRWRTPSKIIFKVPPTFATGEYSYEAGIQEDREKTILEVVYFTKSQIPDCPTEPDDPANKIPDDTSVCKPIPFEDIPGLTKVTVHKLKPVVPEIPSSGPASAGSAAETPRSSITSAEYLNSLTNNINPLTAAAQQQQQQQQQQQIPQAMDPNQAQLQFNLWNTFSQAQNPVMLAAATAAASIGAAPGSDLWNQMHLAAQAQAAAAYGLGGIANFPGVNMPFGFPPPSATPGYSTTGASTTGVIPPISAQNQNQPDQAPVLNNQNRFTGPPNRGGGSTLRSRGGRPNRWDDRGNYDERRRVEELFTRRDQHQGDRQWNNNNNRDRDNRNNDRDRGRGFPQNGPMGRERGGGGGDRGRDLRGVDRNKAGTPRTVLCKFFQQGHCKVGDDCDFLHPGINGPSRRFNSRFSSPPPTQRPPGHTVESPVKPEDDNWDAPQVSHHNTTNFNSTPRSPSPTPMEVDSHPSSVREPPPRVIPINEPEVVVLD